MVLSMAVRPNNNVTGSVAIIGSSVAAIQTALTLAQIGVSVQLITRSAALDCDRTYVITADSSFNNQRFLWPLLLQTSSHPLIKLHTNAEVESIEGDKGNFKVTITQYPRYVREDLCTGCGRCQVECSAKVTSLSGDQKLTHSAIHAPLIDVRSVPSAYVIDKNGFAPCHVECPLGINVQGFVTLLANGKVDRALAIINEAAPLNGILGRVCSYPCENRCTRAKIDSPVSIRALHRYAADNASGGIKYTRKFPAKSREGKIAIVGSGPAGLAAAWELTRLGYSPTVFESHGVIGGMLATGIPRFRLPKEVREREIEALKDLGVDIRTGITVGRDVTFVYLKERGYRAFFLAIGAQLNNKLDIPGEGLDGVVDCMSLLLSLNLKVDTFVGQKVVVIGGGNAAIDAARSAFRSGAKEVTILYRRNRTEIPANAEEVEEGIKEGVKIEDNTIPVEILGDGGRVAGIRCRRTRLTEEIMADDRHGVETIPETDFVVEVDHVVVAVGQSPNASQLNMGNLEIKGDTGVIQVNPLTLETSIPGVFAGGDCISGPNNVVEAMAAGLRAAESIDRYIQGKDLEAERCLKKPQVAEVDIDTIEVSPYERARMPVIRLRKRLNSFEETNTGLLADTAQREAQRCLNCALCSQCMECTRVCELNAVYHDEIISRLELAAQLILKFPTGDLASSTLANNHDMEAVVEGIQVITPSSNGDLDGQIMKAMAVALETAIEIKPKEEEKAVEEIQLQDLTGIKSELENAYLNLDKAGYENKRLGVFLCNCGSSISSILDFRTISRRLFEISGLTCIREIAQACTEAGAREIAEQVVERQLDYVVLAACRCCNLEQVCYSCTDRRALCQKYLNKCLILPHNTVVEFVNIREQCAWAHRDDPQGATRKAVQIISSGIARAKLIKPVVPLKRSILPGALIIGGETTGVSAARALASLGFQVELLSRGKCGNGGDKPSEIAQSMAGMDGWEGVTVKPWPETMELHGTAGNYEAVLKYGSQVDHIETGAVLVDVQELNEQPGSMIRTTPGGGLLGGIISRKGSSGRITDVADDYLREVTIGDLSGVFLIPPDGSKSSQEQVFRGLASAARVSTFLKQASISPRITAVEIDTKLCRGCGDCANLCHYIEMKEQKDGAFYASVDKALCLGCGACVAICPTGAITQPFQSDRQIVSTVRSMILPSKKLVKV